MKVVKYNDKIVKIDSEKIVSKTEPPPPPPTYYVFELHYSTTNCTASCISLQSQNYYTEPYLSLELGTVLYNEPELTTTVSSGYYSDNTINGGDSCYWVDGDGEIVQVDQC